MEIIGSLLVFMEEVIVLHLQKLVQILVRFQSGNDYVSFAIDMDLGKMWSRMEMLMSLLKNQTIYNKN